MHYSKQNYYSQMITIFLVYYLLNFVKDKICNHTKVIHCSDNIIVINKKFDMKINSNDKTEYTVQTFLRNKFPLVASEKLHHEYYFVHRLDYATSGILCIPVHKEACKLFSNAFLMRQTRKYYVAIVRGWVSEEMCDVNIPIGEDTRGRHIQKMCTVDLKYCVRPRNARTVILVLEKGLYDNYPATKILIRPITGRRHQIRVHCNFLGHTIVGDYTYSNKKDTKPFRMFLHSLRLILPNSIENLDVSTEDPFTNCIKSWTSIEIVNNINCESFGKIDELC